MIIPRADLAAEFVIAESIDDLFHLPGNSGFALSPQRGVRSATEETSVPARFLSMQDAIVIVGIRDIIYLTADWKFVAELYPKPWPYARHRIKDSTSLSMDVESIPVQKIKGTLFMPFNVGGNWFHTLFDNYARMYFADMLPAGRELPIGMPFWGCPQTPSHLSDRELLHDFFFWDRRVERLERGVYRVERLIAPPLGNADDYIFDEPARFIARTLEGPIVGRHFTHPTRLFVSRADIDVRNLANESEFATALRRLGFTTLCPGDYAFRTQLEIFGAAEIIVGVHGQGLTPIIAARNCRALVEIEAADWTFTAYRSIAEILGIAYHKLPTRMIDYRNQARFDWLAEVDIPESIALIEQLL